jgi:diacylglycerol kinase family enzyme
MRRRRLAAAGSLLAGAVAMVGAVATVVPSFDADLLTVLGFAVAAAAVRYGLHREGLVRDLALVASGALGGLVLVEIVLLGRPYAELAMVGGFFLSVVLARAAFRVHVHLPPAPRPAKPVLLWNPRSGTGRAAELDLVHQARRRGIEVVVLEPDDDLATLARKAVADGADALAMAGGDGSQAVVAAVAADHDLPYACIPAGTRNHFALDLGVDREDVIGALDALVDGGERRVDLGEVNGQVFVNNVSLGVYARAVQHPQYRTSKVRTLLGTLLDALGRDERRLDFRWRGPDGDRHSGALLVLVSNNPYRLNRFLGVGTRPRLDAGVLGVSVVGRPLGRGDRGRSPQRPLREWSVDAFTVEAPGRVAAGVDGEARSFDSPLRFSVRPQSLRVRIAPQHPGASPSAAAPSGVRSAVRELVRIARDGSPPPIQTPAGPRAEV